jgi:hypothetical protein
VTLAQFLQTVEKYGYDRQGAFTPTCSSPAGSPDCRTEEGAEGPAAVWVHELTRPPQMEQGRKKYSKLLRCWPRIPNRCARWCRY